MLIHAMVDRRSCRHHNLGKLSFGDLRLELADLPVSDSVLTSSTTSCHQCSAGPFSNRRTAGAPVRIAGPGVRPPSLRASPTHVLRRPSGGTYLRCGRVSRASCSTVVLISLTAGG